jgi:hypothetical protein
MKAEWRTLVAQIKLGNISSILVFNLHTGRPPQISLLQVCVACFIHICSTFLIYYSHEPPHAHGPRGLQEINPADGCRVRVCVLGIGSERSESDGHGRVPEGIC